MTKSTSKVAIVTFLLSVSLGVAGASYFYFYGNRSAELTPELSAKLIPKDALFTAFVYRDTKTWNQLKMLGTPALQTLIAKKMQEFTQDSTQESDIRFADDIDPWLGNVMIAMVSRESSASAESSKTDGDIIFILQNNNKLKARAFLKKLEKEDNIDFHENPYRQVKVLDIKSNNQTVMSLVNLEGYIIITSSRSTMQKVIDTHQGSPSILSQPRGGEIFKTDLKLAQPLIDFYIPNYILFSQVIKQDFSINYPVESLVMGVGVTPKGLEFISQTQLSKQNQFIALPTTNNQPLKYFPKETLSVVSGKDLEKAWITFAQQIDSNWNLRQSLSDALSLVNIKINPEDLGGLNGDFALGLIHSKNQKEMGLLLSLQPSDPSALKRLIGNIESGFTNPLFFQQETRQEGDLAVTEWKLYLQSDPLFSYAWNNEDFLLQVKLPLDQSIYSLDDSLTKNPEFQDFIQSLPNPNLGYFYINWEEMEKSLKTLPFYPSQPSSDVEIIISSIQTMMMSGVLVNPQKYQWTMLVNLRSK